MSKFKIVCDCGSSNVKLELYVASNGVPRSKLYCRQCQSRGELNHNLTNDEFKMPFGKYRGMSVAEITRLDSDYANWIAGQKTITEQIRNRFKQSL